MATARLVTLMLLVASLTVGVSSAHAWTAPSAVTASPDGSEARDALIDVDARGNAVVTWFLYRGDGALQLRTVARGGNGGPIETVGLTHSFMSPRHHDIALAPDGDGVIAWVRGDRSGIESRRLTASTLDPTPPMLVSPVGEDPEVAVDKDGNAIVVWTLPAAGSGPARLQYRRVLRDGRFGPVLALATGTRQGTSDALSMRDNGSAVVIWRNGSFVQMRTIAPTDRLGPVRTISSHTAPGCCAMVDVSRSTGHGAIVWTQAQSPGAALLARRVSGDGVLGRPLTLAHGRATRASGQPSFADMAVDAAGNALVAWSTATARPTHLLITRVVRRARLTSPRRLASGPGAFAPRVAVSPRGRGLVTWPGGPNVFARTISMVGRLGLEHIFTPAFDGSAGGEFVQPRMAADGSAILAWPAATELYFTRSPAIG